MSWKWTCLIEIWITMIPKGTSHTSVPNSTYEVPKGTMKTRFEPSLPRMSAWKNNKLHTQDSNPGPLYQLWACWHWTIKARYIHFPQSCLCEDPSWGNKSAKSVSDRQEWQSLVVLNGTNIDLWKHMISCFGGPVTKYFYLGRSPEFTSRKFFSWWHPREPRFKSGFHNSFWDLVVPDRISWMTLEIYNWNLGMSFG